jgi:hypothetical protein
MAEIPFLTLAALTRDVDNAGSGDRLNVTINVAGADVGIAEFVEDHPQAQGYLRHAEAVVSFESTSLTDSSVRIGTRGDDAWAPQHIFLFGQTSRGNVVPIAMETDLTYWLSTDVAEGRLTVPLRLVALGGSDIPIRRLLLLVRTADEDDAETNSLVQLQIKANGNLLFSEVITDTPQDDLERDLSNWYTFDVSPPFTMHDFSLGHGEITLTILGDDAWLPGSLFLFGLDTASGRPTHVVPIVSLPRWGRGVLSTDQEEGHKVVRLPA